mgnify:CR=1 FL=1
MPDTNVDLAPGVALAPAAAPPPITSDQLDLIKRTVAQDASSEELALFLYDCQRRGVHPLDRLLHFTKRGGRYVPVVGIDFMRCRAAETGDCAGIDDAVFSGTPKSADFRAHVTVYRFVHGQRCAFSASARWSEYKPDVDFMWMKMPHVMLGKVAEALALRRAFPVQLAGVYATEELDQAAGPASDAAPGDRQAPARPRAARATEGTISVSQQKRMFAIAKKSGWSTDSIRDHLRAKYQVEHSHEVLVSLYDKVISDFSSAPVPAPAGAAAIKTDDTKGQG